PRNKNIFFISSAAAKAVQKLILIGSTTARAVQGSNILIQKFKIRKKQ
ncbi:11595_t:CDS:1, partial [Scutellospora calospora]